MSALPIPIESARYMMTADEYKRERDALRAMGETSTARTAKYDQALATLFRRSGWTQEQLAKIEGKSQGWVNKRLCFGRFLAFSQNNPNGLNLEKLTEGAYRNQWEKTDKNCGNEYQRFAEVQRLLADGHLSARPRPGLGKSIVAKFGDSKWHELETIADHVEQPAESLVGLLSNMAAKNNNYGVALCEKKQRGKAMLYRIVKASRSIDLDAFMQDLSPILDELDYQGAQHRAAYSPSAVLQCAHRIRRLIEALATATTPSR